MKEKVYSSKLKKYITSTGTYYLKICYQDVIRKEILNRIFDKNIRFIKKIYNFRSDCDRCWCNYGQLSVLFSKLFNDITPIHLKHQNIYLIY